MSVYAYVGLPGAGKSYSVVEFQILPALRAGRQVVTNLPVKVDLLRAEFPSAPPVVLFDVQELAVRPESIMELAPPGCVFVLDEAWRLFPSGQRADKVPEAFRSFFAEHRHRVGKSGDSTQIVVVTQDLGQVSTFCRQLVEETFRMVKLSHVGLSKRFRVDVFNGPVTGPSPPVSQRLRQLPGRYEARVFRFYVSHTMSEAGEEGANESAVDPRANVLRRPIVIAVPLLVVGLLFFVWYRLHYYGLMPARSVRRPAFVGGLLPPGAPPVSRFRAVGVWRVSAVLQGLCFSGRCGWAVLERGSHARFVSLVRCRQVALRWRCSAPSGPPARFVSAPAVLPAARSAVL